MNLSTGIERTFDKIQKPIHDLKKKISKLGIERSFLNLVKNCLQKGKRRKEYTTVVQIKSM